MNALFNKILFWLMGIVVILLAVEYFINTGAEANVPSSSVRTEVLPDFITDDFSDDEVEQFFTPPAEPETKPVTKSAVKSVKTSKAKKSPVWNKKELTTFFRAACEIESHNNPKAVGDQGKAVGASQMWKCVVDDVNRILGRKVYCYEDRWSVEKSREIFEIYLNHYGRHFEKTTGQKATPTILARIWNGGPDGWQEAKTISYGQKVVSKMAQLAGSDKKSSQPKVAKKSATPKKPVAKKPATNKKH